MYLTHFLRCVGFGVVFEWCGSCLWVRVYSEGMDGESGGGRINGVWDRCVENGD